MRYRYWLKSALQLFGAVMLGSVIFSAMLLIQGHYFSIKETLRQCTTFLFTFGSMTQLMFYFSIYKLSIPLTLSFGSTRKEAFWGVQLLRYTLTALCLGLYVLLSAIAGTPIHFLFAVGLFLLAGAAGSLLGILAVRFGKAVTIIASIVFGMLCGVIGVIVGMSADFTFILTGSLSWGVLIAGIVFHLAMFIPEKRTISRLLVRL